MTERLLQFIWQFQYFNMAELETVNGELLQVLQPGQWNHHQGPDFGNARIRIGDKCWAGNVELHLYASDWTKHEHNEDRNYANIILHVVWINDDMRLSDKMPTLELQDRIPNLLLTRYESWMQANTFVPCSAHIAGVDPLVWTAWKDRLLIERLNRKCVQVRAMLNANNNHWEETLWWLLARNFGLHVNADAFEELARSLPVKIVTRHRAQIHQLEALLFGQAGLLKSNGEDKYFTLLKKEYEFYCSKYGLAAIYTPMHFLRMRPPAFPTIRLAQLAMLLHTSGNLLAAVLDALHIGDLQGLLNITANDYWHYHYTFEQTSPYHPKTLGAAMTDTIIINTFVPIAYAYGTLHNEEKYITNALNWLCTANAEKNAVVTAFTSVGVKCKVAADSQSLLELKTQYCNKKRCLDCAVGKVIFTDPPPLSS